MRKDDFHDFPLGDIAFPPGDYSRGGQQMGPGGVRGVW